MRTRLFLAKYPSYYYLITTVSTYLVEDMAYRDAEKPQGKTMIQPINLMFRFLQNRERVCIWLYGRSNMRIEGVIVRYDEFMNIVMDKAAELHIKKRTRREIGRILLPAQGRLHLAHPPRRPQVGSRENAEERE